MRQKLSLEGAFSRGELDPPFHYLPFDLPAGARRLEVSYHFERSGGEGEFLAPRSAKDNVVDIGLFDQRGADFLGGGFRGWSGGARSGFFVAINGATPGYIRGPLLPGQWQVILGCPVLAGDRCRYWVDVSIDVEPDTADPEHPPAGQPSAQPAPEAAQRASADSNNPSRWYRGDLHTHTVHSDGYNTIGEYVQEASRIGLDFLAITHHNTCSHFQEIASRDGSEPLLIPGEEVTTAWGHANVWGIGRWVDFRCTDDAGMQRILDSVRAAGGLFSPNHPKVGYPWQFDGVQGYRIVEAWQGPWRLANSESLAFWERRLLAGERVTAVGGSDCHAIPPAVRLHPWTPGAPCTWIYAPAPLDERGVLDALRAGQVFVSEDPTGPFLELTAECAGRSYLMGDAIDAPSGASVRFRLNYRGPAEKKLRLLRNGELWRETVADKEETVLEFDLQIDEPGYVRAEVMGFRGRPERGEVVHALTNPIYIRPEDG